MISQRDLPGYIEKSMPELSDICKKGKCETVYEVVRALMKYTSYNVKRRKINIACQCMALAEQLYKRGNSTIKNAIENVYVYSFTHAFFYDEHQRKELSPLIPASLYALYKKQVIHSHL